MNEFKVGDWVYIKDGKPTCCEGYFGDSDDYRGSWQKVTDTSNTDVEFKSGDLLGKKHVTLNPFKEGDKVKVQEGATYGGDKTPGEVYDFMREKMTQVTSATPDEVDDIRVSGFYVHKRFVLPDPGMEIPFFKGDEQPDMVNSPPHYTQGLYEPIDVIDDWDLPYNLGNALKYIARHAHKGNPAQDLDKAIWYLERERAKYDD